MRIGSSPLEADAGRWFHGFVPIAELHGKSGPEDTLTSGALGLLTVLPPAFLSAWLRRARRLDGAELAVPGDVTINAAFWPQLYDGAGPCEPDALLSVAAEGQILGVLVEVKYQSDMSGWPTPVEHDDQVRAQLGREWEALRLMADHVFPGDPVEVHRRVLVYVTPAATLPHATLGVVARELKDKGRDADAFLLNSYWVSWFTLSEIVRAALEDDNVVHRDRVALVRLFDLLKARKLSAFTGIRPPIHSVAMSWRYVSRLNAYPTAPTTQTVSWSYSRREIG